MPAEGAGSASEEVTAAARPRPASLRLRRILGIDFHILQTLLLRGWSILAGGVMVLLVPRWFDAKEQGYYYTFLSLIAVQIFFELGMNQIIVQFVSHEAAHLTTGENGQLIGQRAAITRLASLVQLIRHWYLIAAIVFLVVVGGVGSMFFLAQERPAGLEEIAIWLVLVFFTSINLALSPSLAVIEGFGHVGDVARLRLAQSISGYLAMWAALSLGAGLAATPFLAGASVACTWYWLQRHDRRIRWLRGVTIDPREETLDWRRDILPLQWRIAVSWISGYLILQLLVPMAFAHQGAVEAGRLGLTLTIFNSLLSVGLSWVNARLPTMAAHLARGERASARQVFWSVLARSPVVTAAGSLFVCGAVLLLLPEAIRTRLADTPTIVGLSIATIANCVIYAMATYVRAHKEEPLLLQSVVSAIVMVPAVYFGSVRSIATMMTLFAGVIVLLSLPWVAAIFYRYYRREV